MNTTDCNLLVNVALNVQLSTNKMCVKNSIICKGARTSSKSDQCVISIVACCQSVMLWTLAAQAFRLQYYYNLNESGSEDWLCHPPSEKIWWHLGAIFNCDTMALQYQFYSSVTFQMALWHCSYILWIWYLDTKVLVIHHCQRCRGKQHQ